MKSKILGRKLIVIEGAEVEAMRGEIEAVISLNMDKCLPVTNASLKDIWHQIAQRNNGLEFVFLKT